MIKSDTTVGYCDGGLNNIIILASTSENNCMLYTAVVQNLMLTWKWWTPFLVYRLNYHVFFALCWRQRQRSHVTQLAWKASRVSCVHTMIAVEAVLRCTDFSICSRMTLMWSLCVCRCVCQVTGGQTSPVAWTGWVHLPRCCVITVRHSSSSPVVCCPRHMWYRCNYCVDWGTNVMIVCASSQVISGQTSPAAWSGWVHLLQCCMTKVQPWSSSLVEWRPPKHVCYRHGLRDWWSWLCYRLSVDRHRRVRGVDESICRSAAWRGSDRGQVL